MSSRRFSDRSVFGDLNARNQSEVIDNIFDRTIITTNSANILNIMSESPALNPEEEVIRKRGRKKTPKVSQLPLRRSPRKTYNPSAIESQSSTTSSEQTHDYFLRTPKKTPTKSVLRTPSKSVLTPLLLTPRRVSPRKRLQLDGNDSGIGLTPMNGQELTPTSDSTNAKTISKPKNKTLFISKRRRRRYF